MIRNLFKLFGNEFLLMAKGSIFTLVIYSLLLISSSIFALSLRHISFGIEIPIAFLWIMIFFITLIKVEKVYSTDFSESKLQQYTLSPFALELIIFIKNIMIFKTIPYFITIPLYTHNWPKLLNSFLKT